jgi:copper(I)-binding protein
MKTAANLILGLALAVSVAADLHAQAPDSKAIAVQDPWARATPRGVTTGAAYVTLSNDGASADELVSVTTPVANTIQFHKETEENGISHMRQLRTVELPAGAKVTFAPGDMHMMMLGLKQPLIEGQAVPLTFVFKNAGKIDVMAPVAKVGATRSSDPPRP